MHEHEPNPCKDLVSFLIGEGSEIERVAFEKHLRSCASCKIEWNELQAVWSSLPFNMNEVEVPQDLKSDVMAAIDKLEQEQTLQQPIAIAITKKRSPLFIRISLIASAIIIGILIGVFGILVINPPPVETASIRSDTPTELLKTVELTSADSSMPLAKGTAWVMKQGESQHIVIQLQGLTETQGETAYQAWLIKNGRRYNCGTFYVDGNGAGVLTYEIDARYVEFDAIGVTLEPDANGKQPRGSKVLGT